MKKSVFVFGLCVILVQFGTAQLKVANNGNVGICLDPPTLTPLSALAIGGTGSTATKVDVTSSTATALNINRSGYLLGVTNVYGISATTSAGPNTNIAIKGQCTTMYPMGVGVAYGLLGVAGNHTSGYNYGVYGTVSSGGAGIVGTINNNLNVSIDGSYVGYFVGVVKVVGCQYSTVICV
jgi:hypothetical protein